MVGTFYDFIKYNVTSSGDEAQEAVFNDTVI